MACYGIRKCYETLFMAFYYGLVETESTAIMSLKIKWKSEYTGYKEIKTRNLKRDDT